MNKVIRCVLIAASASWMVGSQTAQAAEGTNTVPWYNSFEDNTVGASITNDVGWNATEDSVAMVTNIPDYFSAIQSPVVSYPLTNANHGPFNNVLAFNSTGLSNELDSTADQYGNIWVDMMIQPVQMEQPPVSSAVSNSQMSMYVNTSGYVCVYHAILTNTTSHNYTPDGYGWTVLDDFPPIETGKWVRVTVQMDYSRFASTRAFFQLKVNNHTFSNALAFVDAADIPGDAGLYTNTYLNGSWFLCANNNDFKLNGVAFSGTGLIDDMVVTNGPVTIEEVAVPVAITATAHGHGTVSPSGTVTFAATPADTNFVITADQFYHISQVLTNGAAVNGVSEAATNFYDLTWNGIASIGTLDAYFAPDMAANNTPMWWLNQYGLTNDTANWDAEALADSDDDGAFNWQEFVAGTVPTNPASVLKIVSGQVANGTGTVVWLSTANMPDTNAVKYVVQVATNLATGPWFPLSSMSRADGTLTNIGDAIYSPAFFRVSFTNQ